MKLKDAMPIYQRYRQQLVDQTRSLVKQRDAAKAKFEATNDQTWSDEAATLQLSIEKTQEEFNKNQEVLDGLTEQWCRQMRKMQRHWQIPRQVWQRPWLRS